MSGYRGDGYGVYGDHGDEDFYDEMRRERDNGRTGPGDRMRSPDSDWRMRDRDTDWRGRERHDDDRRRFMLGEQGEGDRGRWRDDDRYGAENRERGRMGPVGDRVSSWVREHNEDPYHPSRHESGRGRDDDRGQGFLERAGHETQEWMRDDDRSGSRAPMGLTDRFRQGGGLGMNRGEQRFSGSGPHDHYLSWRERQIAELDRDYDEYCRENEHKFSSDFQSWRQNRQSSQGMGMSGASPASGSSVDMGGASGAGTASAQPGASGSEIRSDQDASGSGDSKQGRPKR